MKRIENHGNYVCPQGRINSKLIVSRSFGDYQFKNTFDGKFKRQKTSVIVKPDVIRKPILLLDSMVDHCIILASDGIWDVITHDYLWYFMRTPREKPFKKLEQGNTSSGGDDNDLLGFADHLIYKSSKLGSKDNCTMIIVKISKNENGW